MTSDDPRYQRVPDRVVEHHLKEKFTQKYSERLGHMVYVLKEWLDKNDFERHKKLFGYTDIGWTVKYPRQLSRALVREGIWSRVEERGS